MGELINLANWRSERHASSAGKEIKIGGRKVLEFGITNPTVEPCIDEAAVQEAAQALYELEMAIRTLPSGMQRVITLNKLSDKRDECINGLSREERWSATANFREMLESSSPEAS
jgi:hypothetical protein